jgi:hypothetical protein
MDLSRCSKILESSPAVRTLMRQISANGQPLLHSLMNCLRVGWRAVSMHIQIVADTIFPPGHHISSICEMATDM